MAPIFAMGFFVSQTPRWNPTHMNDTVWLALIGLATVFVAGFPATVTALATRRLAAQARDHAASAADAAAEVKQTIGVKNGNGDVTTMLVDALAELAELSAWTNEHQATDLADFTAVQTRLAMVEKFVVDIDDLLLHRTERFDRIDETQAEFEQRVRGHLHEIRNLLTPVKGRVDLLWADYATAHNIEETP